MRRSDKVIITCAITGSVHTPSMSPHLPVTANEIADQSIAAAEAGAAIDRQYSKTVAELPTLDFDLVVTVCGHANENCPIFPARAKVVHVGFDDPPRLARDASSEEEALGHYRRVRDEIRAFVETLPDLLKGNGEHNELLR